ncbi:uncharacterized protein DUF3244 [Bacteroides heparinolyticus]|uniref:Uncharacterized protein DUF3244 n=1 Tax=Prevotella heparinolytica TaxID=28113 RepID=A0A4R2LGC4_9BACE|nr:DUF3244 domain-containing protein [Bacteroides heparinolyticus]TCO86870.1 uncharacterized protein DUF3244 [Bacteroides heparinolyticus]TCO86876.1 uncharacterized protein DUF3244 [Bacteroides heparinolyticus]
MRHTIFLMTLLLIGFKAAIQARGFNSYTEIPLTIYYGNSDKDPTEDDPDIGPDNQPITRGIIFQPAYAHLYNKVVNIYFVNTYHTAVITISNQSTGEIVYSETHDSPTKLSIDLSSKSYGNYLIRIETESVSLQGSFSL